MKTATDAGRARRRGTVQKRMTDLQSGQLDLSLTRMLLDLPNTWWLPHKAQHIIILKSHAVSWQLASISQYNYLNERLVSISSVVAL